MKSDFTASFDIPCSAFSIQRQFDDQKNFKPPADTVAAMGNGKNRCYVIPSLGMVVIRMGDSEGREFSDNEFLAKLLGQI